MAEPFLSEIRVMSFVFAPKGWALCNGQLLPINQNQALFSLMGTTYGGNGQTNFALPNLRGRVPMHVGAGHNLGESSGAATHTLSSIELPMHTHAARGSSNAGDTLAPVNNILGVQKSPPFYGRASNLTPLHPSSLLNAGGSQPHENRQPYLTLTFCIALQGIFPSQN